MVDGEDGGIGIIMNINIMVVAARSLWDCNSMGHMRVKKFQKKIKLSYLNLRADVSNILALQALDSPPLWTRRWTCSQTSALVRQRLACCGWGVPWITPLPNAVSKLAESESHADATVG